jgi:predicted oxidoreductase
VQLSSSERDKIVVQSKMGIVADPWYYDSSYEHIVDSAEASLNALQTDYLDVLLLHRPDALVEPEEVVRAFGVSNHTPRRR